ncbi:MAG: hypothetical protein U0271_16875 [Polyangiaceae bacterium]
MPVGATGSVVTCNEQSKGAAAEPLRGRFALTSAYTKSYVSFGDVNADAFDFDLGENVDFERLAVVAENDFFFGKYTFSVVAGGVLAGTLSSREATYTVDPGWLVAANLSWRVFEEKGNAPYVLLNVSLGAMGASTSFRDLRGRYYGFDFRFGLTAGKTFEHVFSPYLAFRIFGGPILWDMGDGALTLGSDRYHVQPALGFVVILPGGGDFFVEGSPVGEQAASLGVGWAYF